MTKKRKKRQFWQRIIVICSLISILLSSIAIPSFAVEETSTAIQDSDFYVSGIWILNDELTVPTWTSEDVSFIYCGKKYIQLHYHRANIDFNDISLGTYYSFSGSLLTPGTYSSNWFYLFSGVSSSEYNNFWNPRGKIFDFGSLPQIVSADFFNWLDLNGSPLSSQELTIRNANNSNDIYTFSSYSGLSFEDLSASDLSFKSQFKIESSCVYFQPDPGINEWFLLNCEAPSQPASPWDFVYGSYIFEGDPYVFSGFYYGMQHLMPMPTTENYQIEIPLNFTCNGVSYTSILFDARVGPFDNSDVYRQATLYYTSNVAPDLVVYTIELNRTNVILNSKWISDAYRIIDVKSAPVDFTSEKLEQFEMFFEPAEYSNVYDAGYYAGFTAGFDEGKYQGVGESLGESFTGNLFSSIIRGLDSFTIVGGFSLWNLIQSLVGFMVVLFVLKLISGG